MKTLFKKILVAAAIFAATLSTVSLSSTPVYADGNASNYRYFLGMASWDCNTIENPKSQDELQNNVWIIVSNISIDITTIASYLVLGFVIYGGYLYILSGGDVGKATAGKRTLTNAFIGLAIVLLANIIINTIRIAFLSNAVNAGQNCAETACVDANTLVSNLIGWIIGVTGLVAVIFVVIGGVGYMTSAGDPSKVQKSRKTLTYALIGLAIVGLSGIITAFVTNLINNASNTAYINETVIAKEISNEK